MPQRVQLRASRVWVPQALPSVRRPQEQAERRAALRGPVAPAECAGSVAEQELWARSTMWAGAERRRGAAEWIRSSPRAAALLATQAWAAVARLAPARQVAPQRALAGLSRSAWRQARASRERRGDAPGRPLDPNRP
jgi:hypothetical protein